jgi:hypothetical protein
MSMNWYRAILPRMALKGTLTSAMLKTMLSVRSFSSVPSIIGWEMLPRGMMEPRPTPKNGCEGSSLDMGIYNFWKAARLIRLRAAPPSIRMWYNLMLAMVREMTSGSYPAPTIFLGQSEASKQIDISIHLWCGAALGAGAVVVIARHRVLMTRLDVMSQKLSYMTWSCLRHSL